MLIGIVLGFIGGFISLLNRLAPDLLPFGKDRSQKSTRSESPPEDDPDR